MGSITIGTKTVTGINIGTGIDVGTKTTSITENGTYDVNVFGYAANSISVSVSGGGGVDTDFLCFTAEEANSTVGINIGSDIPFDITLYISTDNQQTFTQWDGSTVTLANVGDKMYLYGSNAALASNSSSNQCCYFTMTGSIAASGDVTSLLSRYGVTALKGMEFLYLFRDCASLTTAPSLPSTRVGAMSYYGTFYNCTGLTTAPALPATILAPYCYYQMFYNCTALTTAPATLPATTVSTYCCYSMFLGCTSLTAAPALPATTLAQNCYYQMFYNCTALTTAPATLPATTLANGCYSSMFQGCTSLTTAPALPATTLAQNCYYQMFYNCTALTTAPATLPATTLANGCYSSMFQGCTSLTTAPSLPATTLAQNCCYSMFQGCTSLTAAPELPATTLANGCYNQMFRNCSSLNHIQVGATAWNVSYANNWVYGVQTSSGTFIKPSSTIISVSANGIPYGWTVVNDSKTITLTAAGQDDLEFEYTYDGTTATVASGTSTSLTIVYNNGLSVTTDGPKCKLCINGVEKGNGPTYSLAYTDLSNGDVLNVIFDNEPS